VPWWVLPALLLPLSRSAAQASSTAAPAVRGIVTDAASGAAVADAQVLLVTGTDTVRTVTGADGSFRVAPSPTHAGAERAALSIRRLGFAPATLPAHAAADTVLLRVRLTPLALRLDATVVSAARREQRLKDAVVPTELVSREQIERTGASDVATVLTTQLGVQLEGGVPAGAGVQLQGLGTNRVLILVDGQPLVGRINGNLDLSRLPTANLERIEVVKGPQSTLYGSDAMGGVINLVTRRPERGHTDGSLQITSGSRGRLDMHGALRRGGERMDASLDVGSRAIQLAPGLPGTTGTFAERLEAAPQLRVRAGEAWTLESGGMFITERQRYRTGQLFRFADRQQLAARLGAAWQRGASRGGVLVYHTQFDHLARASTLDRPQSAQGDQDQQALTELEVTWSSPVGRAILDAGLEARREGIVADRVDGRRRDFAAVEPFAQATVGGERFSVMPGARFTWNERWGNYATPRIAALWRPASAFSVRGTVGRGFRAPDFKELYLAFANPQAGYAVEGNLDLRPETSTSAQLQLEYAADRLYLRASAYDNRLRDFIEFVEAGAAGLFTYGNVAEARTRGVEGESGLTLGRGRLEGGIAYLDARDTRTGLLLLGRPRWSGRLSASAGRLLGARGSATLVHTGATPTQRANDGTVIATQRAFTRVDMRVVRPIRQAVSVAIGVDNAFDRQLGADWPGFTGRLWHASMSWTPGAR
jgi:outer membrane receptor for ferrienterochelin and colicins